MQELNEKRHITEEMWIAVKNDTIRPEEFAQILAHTGTCTWCAERLAEAMAWPDAEQQSEVPEHPGAAQQPMALQTCHAVLPPAYLQDEIRERIKQLDIQTSVAVRSTSRKLQLALYSLKVGAAVAFSIFILVITANFRQMDVAPPDRPVAEERKGPEQNAILDKMNQLANGVTERMSEFTNQILNGGKEK